MLLPPAWGNMGISPALIHTGTVILLSREVSTRQRKELPEGFSRAYSGNQMVDFREKDCDVESGVELESNGLRLAGFHMSPEEV